MTEQKTPWTSGPWGVGLDRRGRTRVFSPEGHEIVRALSEHGAKRLSEAERSANRHLIAAAPELYEALEDIVNGFDEGRVTVEATNFARTVLKKARGQS